MDAWRINTDHRMALIFDAVNPARQFKRGEILDEKADADEAFPTYSPSPSTDLNVTEVDEHSDGDLKPYAPIDFL
jgi:hypothetical protein